MTIDMPRFPPRPEHQALPWQQIREQYETTDADSGDREQSVHSIMNTDSGDHEHLFAPA
jgi:hypothetical protein